MSVSLRPLVLALALVFAAAPATAVATPVDYGLAKLASAAGVPAAQLSVRVASGDPTLGPDDFTLARDGTRLLVSSGSQRGAMYGLLELAEQVRRGTGLAQVRPATV